MPLDIGALAFQDVWVETINMGEYDFNFNAFTAKIDLSRFNNA
jgi:hypothetical protein